MAIVYDRTTTIVRGTSPRGGAVPIHPEAAAFAAHYGFAIDVLVSDQQAVRDDLTLS
jgi:hypothetical protein